MDDRFKIKKRKRFVLPKRVLQTLNFIIFLIFYILILTLTSQKGAYLKNGFDALPLSFKIGEIENKKFYATSKSIYFINEENSYTFPFFIRDFKVDGDKIFLLSDNLVILNKDLKILKEIKKDGFYPFDLYFFDNTFVVKYFKNDSLSMLFSLFDKNSFKELKSIKFENLTSIPYSISFSNGERVLVFQNDGDLLIVNFDKEIILQKNIRPKNEILFNPRGLIDETKKKIILYWQSYSYTNNSILFLNYSGDIEIKFDIKNEINDVVEINDRFYLLLNEKISIVENEKIVDEISIPFFRPVRIFNLNGKLISIWEFKNFLSQYKILKINGKNYIFKGKFKDIIFNNGEYLILIDSKIYTIKDGWERVN